MAEAVRLSAPGIRVGSCITPGDPGELRLGVRVGRRSERDGREAPPRLKLTEYRGLLLFVLVASD